MPSNKTLTAPFTTPSAQFIEPLAVKPADAWRLLGIGNTHGYQLLRDGELVSYLDGTNRRITTESIRNYIARQVATSRGVFQRERFPSKHKTTGAA
jgi:excisionase family DNA binding protein